MDLSKQEQNRENDLIKVVICEDQPIIVSGLEHTLNNSGRFQVIGKVNSSEKLMESMLLVDADILILDLRLPGKDGFHALQWVVRQYKNVKTVIFSVDDSPFIVKKTMEHGASAFVSKNQDTACILSVLERTMAGEPFFALSDRYMPQDITTGQNIITPREREILCKLVKGKKSRDVALELSLSENTVNTHRRNIMQKLGLHDLVSLIRYAEQNRICP